MKQPILKSTYAYGNMTSKQAMGVRKVKTQQEHANYLNNQTIII